MKNLNYKKFKKKVDNKMKWYGDTDFDKHLIRINKHMAKKAGHDGELIDSIIHERNHVLHPKKSEKAIIKLTARDDKKFSKKKKASLYKGYEKK